MAKKNTPAIPSPQAVAPTTEPQEQKFVPFADRPKKPPFSSWMKMRAARELLLDKQEYLAYGVCALRAPVLTRSMPTAGVGADADGEITLYFNPDFVDTLDVQELAMVMAHEALHVLSGHIEGMKTKENPVLWNICADIFVNTWLLQNAQFEISQELKDSLWDNDKVGIDASTLIHYADTEDIYDQLLPQTKLVEKLIKEYLQSLMNGDVQPDDGSGKGQSSAGATLDEHAGWNAVNQAACDNVMRELASNGMLDQSNAVGKTPAGIARAFNDVNQDFAWEKHIERFVASVVRREETWERPNRRLVAGGFGEIMVPGQKLRYDYTIFAYVDMSGSIGPDEVNRFRAILLRKPVEVAIRAFTFDTKIYEWLNWEKTEPRGGGGTDFQAVVDHAQHLEQKTRCDGVVVLTDGFCSEPTVAKPKRWLWVSTEALLSKASGTWVKMPEIQHRQQRRKLFR